MTRKEKIVKAVKDHWLEHGRSPAHARAVSEALKFPEEKFYDHFASVEAVEEAIWFAFFTDTLDRLDADSATEEYGAREYLLAFYYTLFEVLKPERSYVVLRLKELGVFHIQPEFLKRFREAYIAWVKLQLAAATESREIRPRWLLSDKYPDLMWRQCAFLLHFWAKDSSEGFQDSDEAVEKAVNVGFDAMGDTLFDSALDFGKFMWNKFW